MAQKASYANGKGIDRISCLPDDIICHIISYLPIRETIRTSVLSRRWRYLFTWTNNLTIDDNIESKAKFGYGYNAYIVNKLLFSRRRPTIDRFGLIFREYVDPTQFDGWLHYALWHGVQELELCIPTDFYRYNEFHSAIWLFSCKTLVTLKLEFGDEFVLEVPDTVCLPNLKVLQLRQIKFSDNESVQRLFSGCYVLDELLVRCCRWENISRFTVSNRTLKRLILRSLICSNPFCQELVINTPCLVYFEHFDLVATNYPLLNLESLVEAIIDVGSITLTSFYQTAAADLLKGISNIQSLHLGSNFSRAYGLHRVPKFPNLTYLKINTSYCYDWESMLDSSPCLETLVIKLELPWLADTLWLPRRAPSCLLSNLKTIKFFSFHGDKDELQLIEYFLMNARALQNLTIYVSEEKGMQSEVTKALETLQRGSKNCHVMFG